MSNVVIQRHSESAQGTTGELTVEGKTWTTLELPWRGNKPYISRIPAGDYPGERYESRRFGYSLGIRDVEGRSSILIHTGNFAGAAPDWQTDSYGCVLLGKKLRSLYNRNGADQVAVLSSRQAIGEFREWLRSLGAEPTVIIRDIPQEQEDD